MYASSSFDTIGCWRGWRYTFNQTAVQTNPTRPVMKKDQRQPSFAANGSDAIVIYLDSSALLKLVHPEPETPALRQWLTGQQGVPAVSSVLPSDIGV